MKLPRGISMTTSTSGAVSMDSKHMLLGGRVMGRMGGVGGSMIMLL